MGWYREAVQLGRAACVLRRSPGPPVLTWSLHQWNAGNDRTSGGEGGEVDGRQRGANRRHRAADGVTSGGCAACPHGKHDTHTGAPTPPWGKRFSIVRRRRAGRSMGGEVDGRHWGVNRRHRAVTGVVSGGCAAAALTRATCPCLSACPHINGMQETIGPAAGGG